jgi:predicted GIY-YIG superfamily endonuclease
MARDYNFWIYILTNRNHSVLYIGITNRLSRRTWSTERELNLGLLPSINARNWFTTSIIATFVTRSPANRS